MATEHRTMTGAQLHEPKGAATATANQVYVADGVGSGSWTSLSSLVPSTYVTQGVYDYNDLLTATTPITLVTAGTKYELTNDGVGTFTNTSYALAGVGDVWDTSTNRFDFSGLSLGDTVDIRIDVEFTTGTNNVSVDLAMELGLGVAPYELTILSNKDHDVAGTYQEVHMFSVYMGDTGTLNNPARILASSSDNGTTVKVNGWYVRVLHTN